MTEPYTKTTSNTVLTGRFSMTDITDAMKKSAATPIFVAEGTALEVGTQIRSLGNKQVSVVVLV